MQKMLLRPMIKLQSFAYLVAFPLLILLDSMAVAHEDVSINTLTKPCRTVVMNEFTKIRNYQSTPELLNNTSLTVSKDFKGHYAISFSAMSGEFGAGDRQAMINISRRINSECPQVALISFSGSTWSNWTMRRDGFSRVHHKYDDNYSGDVDFYWNWDKLPFDYDPKHDYFPN